MYWFLMTSTKYSSGFGTVVPPMIKAVRSGVELVPQFASSANATPGGIVAAKPTPSATANAPTRPMNFALPMMIPRFDGADLRHRIVAPVAQAGLSRGILQ